MARKDERKENWNNVYMIFLFSLLFWISVWLGGAIVVVVDVCAGYVAHKKVLYLLHISYRFFSCFFIRSKIITCMDELCKLFLIFKTIKEKTNFVCYRIYICSRIALRFNHRILFQFHPNLLQIGLNFSTMCIWWVLSFSQVSWL